MFDKNTVANAAVTATSSIICSVLGSTLFFFVGPLLMMHGWDAVAWHCNLPTFDYWQMFCVCNGLRWFLKGITPFR